MSRKERERKWSWALKRRLISLILYQKCCQDKRRNLWRRYRVILPNGGDARTELVTLTFVSFAQSQIHRQCSLVVSVGSESGRVLGSQLTQLRKVAFRPEREPTASPLWSQLSAQPRRPKTASSLPNRRPPPHRRDATHAAGAGGDGAGVRRGRPHRPLRAGNAFSDHPSLLYFCLIPPLIPRPAPALTHSALLQYTEVLGKGAFKTVYPFIFIPQAFDVRFRFGVGPGGPLTSSYRLKIPFLWGSCRGESS